MDHQIGKDFMRLAAMSASLMKSGLVYFLAIPLIPVAMFETIIFVFLLRQFRHENRCGPLASQPS
jgi:hypothetical protein